MTTTTRGRPVPSAALPLLLAAASLLAEPCRPFPFSVPPPARVRVLPGIRPRAFRRGVVRRGGLGASSSPSSPSAAPDRPSPDLHPPALDAVADALLLRARNDPKRPLRTTPRDDDDDGSEAEPWEVTLTAGNVARSVAERWATEEGLDAAADEGAQVMAGRTVAVLTRLDELEEVLLARRGGDAEGEEDGAGDAGRFVPGVPDEELAAWRSEGRRRGPLSDAAIDAACLFDEKLRRDRARSLLALFLEEVEGPGLRRNGVVLPCMEVDFLSEEERRALFGKQGEDGGDVEEGVEPSMRGDAHSGASATEGASDLPERPSLHPIALDAIEEAFRLRAQNSTTSPLRLVDGRTEWFEVQYSIVKFADRFLEKHSRPSKADTGDDEHSWTEDELQAVGGRIVGVLTRLDDLEWEWNHRVGTSPLASLSQGTWKTTLGLHPGDVEQRCARTLDLALSSEADFARARAEKMLALFLLNVEGPGLEASGNAAPGGSDPDFVEDRAQLELMMPRARE